MVSGRLREFQNRHLRPGTIIAGDAAQDGAAVFRLEREKRCNAPSRAKGWEGFAQKVKRYA
jgi:hypothetical protein